MRKAILSGIVCLTVMGFLSIYSTAEAGNSYCRSVNASGTVVNAGQMANVMDRWLALKGVDYRTSASEVSTTIRNFCSNRGYATVDDVTDHLQNIVNYIAANQ